MIIRAHLARAAVDPKTVEILSVERSLVAAEVRRIDAGVFFVKPTYSTLAAAPTRLAEYLGCGIPCLLNDSGGDMAGIVESENVGVVLREWDRASQRVAAEHLVSMVRDPIVAERCVRAAHKYFSLSSGVVSYRRVYDSLTSTRDTLVHQK